MLDTIGGGIHHFGDRQLHKHPQGFDLQTFVTVCNPTRETSCPRSLKPGFYCGGY
jgi:hypothetical protein